MQQPKHWHFFPYSPTLCTVVVKAVSFEAKIKPHKVLPAIRTLSSLYSSFLLSLSGFLIAFITPPPPPPLEVSLTSCFWVPAPVCSENKLIAPSMAVKGFGTNLYCPGPGAGKGYTRAKTFKIWSWVSAWTDNSASRTGKTWKCYGKERILFLKTHLRPVRVTVGLQKSEQSSSTATPAHSWRGLP